MKYLFEADMLAELLRAAPNVLPAPAHRGYAAGRDSDIEQSRSRQLLAGARQRGALSHPTGSSASTERWLATSRCCRSM